MRHAQGGKHFCQGESTGGCLDREESNFHINALEILAVFYALKSFMKDQEGVYVLILSDNQSVVAHINKMGGTRSRHLIALTRRIWTWCPKRKLQLSPSRQIEFEGGFPVMIPKRQNRLDTESRHLCCP